MKHCSVSLHNMKHSLRSYYEKMKKWELEWSSVRVRANPHKFSPNSPLQEVTRPLPEKEKHLKHTASLWPLTPKRRIMTSTLKNGGHLVGRNVIKGVNKIKKILWPLADRIFQIKLTPTSRPPKNIVFCSKPHFLQVIIPQLIQYAKIPLNAISHPMTSAKDLLPQNPRSFG